MIHENDSQNNNKVSPLQILIVEDSEHDMLAFRRAFKFSILVINIMQLDDIHMIAPKILDVFKTPFTIHKHSLCINTSIGISIYPDHGDDSDTLLNKADNAMYLVKQENMNNYLIYQWYFYFKIMCYCHKYFCRSLFHFFKCVPYISRRIAIKQRGQ